jgi:hypothetical protein
MGMAVAVPEAAVAAARQAAQVPDPAARRPDLAAVLAEEAVAVENKPLSCVFHGATDPLQSLWNACADDLG